jgi:hypothetical protein
LTVIVIRNGCGDSCSLRKRRKRNVSDSVIVSDNGEHACQRRRSRRRGSTLAAGAEE